MSMLCSKCPGKVIAKGLCNRCYYSAKKKSTDPKDVAIYQTRPAELAALKYAAKTKEQRIAYSQDRRKKFRADLNKIVPELCALHHLSKCSTEIRALFQDHDHSCPCGKRTGCQSCFRGLLCHEHNRWILPIIEKFNKEHIPELVRTYLSQRPLVGTDVHPFAH